MFADAIQHRGQLSSISGRRSSRLNSIPAASMVDNPSRRGSRRSG
jgi:hypothetical protein